jgi:hypothetical protein
MAQTFQRRTVTVPRQAQHFKAALLEKRILWEVIAVFADVPSKLPLSD